ncbi:MAG: hypothetical protein JXR78_18050 [Victivallales bacterium]|nr:hypothetical protein [Victivallales bacterium]
MNETEIQLQNIGGAYQHVISRASDLRLIEKLDPALWAAVSAPLSSFNCDARFLSCLDADGSGRINISDLMNAWKWQKASLADISVIDADGGLSAEMIAPASPDGQALIAAFEIFAAPGLEAVTVELPQVQDKIKELQCGKLSGDGIIVSDAVTQPGAQELVADVIRCSGGKINSKGQTGITLDQFNKFMSDADAYIDWIGKAENADFLPRGEKTAETYNKIKVIAAKIEEYFRYCKLIKADANNALRFTSNPEEMPPLDVSSPEAIDEYLAAAPLATPSATQEINLLKDINPAYAEAAAALAGVAKYKTLTLEKWEALKAEFAPYEQYLNSIPGSEVEKTGCARIREYLSGEAAGQLRELFDADGQLNGKLDKLFKLEKLLLFNRDMIRFTNNFVSFRELFTAGTQSMIQAGSLIMDGRHFNMVVYVDDQATHKKLVPNSNIYVMYLKISRVGEPKPLNLAAAVTSGSSRNIYVGKRGVFIDHTGRDWEAEITELILEPVSMREAFFLPVKKLGELITSRVNKFTESSSKSLTTNLDKQITATPAPPASPPASNFSTSALLLGGGVGVAALGSSFALIINSLKGVHIVKILISIAVLAFIVSLPLIITAAAKLRKRNLALFLESAGWAINFEMRLTRKMGKLFTRRPRFSGILEDVENSQKKGEKPVCFCRYLLYAAIIITLLTAIIVTVNVK